MGFSIKKIAVAGLLLLTGAKSAPAPVAEADTAATEPEVGIKLKRYYSITCHGHKHHDRKLPMNQCQGFQHGFFAFKLVVPEDEAQWNGVGQCKLSFYRDQTCNELAFSIPDIQTGEQLEKCGWMGNIEGGAITHGVKLECSKDEEEQVEEVEVEVGDVFRMD